MSSDTAKENASVVDSSVTEWKHEMGNSDDLESPEYKDKYEEFPSRADKGSYNQQVNASTKGRQGNTRYFIIKSLNHQNIQLSIEKGIWATQVMNEPILEEAFHNSGKVILIFSVNMSGFFQGYAQMMSSVGWRRDNVWSQGSSKNNPWGRSFKVKWLRLNDLPFQKTLHLKNPLNDFKPVKISRDCQELPEDIGEALCGLIDGETNTDDSVVKRFTKDVVSKRPYVEHPCSIGDVEYNNVSALHMPWASTPMSYNPFFYQHHAEAGTNRNFNSLQVDVPGRLDAWGLSADSPLASTLTDDDFLEMTYEEYLEVHSRSMKSMNGRSGGNSLTQESAKNRDDDSESSPATDRCRPRKRLHRSPQK